MLMNRKQCLREYGSDYYIQKKVKSGELFQIDKGIYSLERHVPVIALLAYKYPDAVLTMRSAFYMHALTDVIPDEYDLATERNAAKIPDKRVKQYFVSEDFFTEGIEQVDYKGYAVKIYSKERMLIELLKYKSKLPFDYYKEIILNYRRILPRLDVQRIQDYALVAPRSNKILSTLQLEVF